MDALDKFDKLDAEYERVSSARYKPGDQPKGIKLSKK